REQNVMVWYVAGCEEIVFLPGHEKLVSSVAFSPDNLLLASGSFGGVLRIWDVRTGDLLWKVQAQDLPIAAVAFRPDGRWVTTASYDRTVKFWDVTTRQEVRTL